MALPFLSAQDYDHLLWYCDVNFVRGEDSFVRAQWAARPLVWHIYPQSDAAHEAKLAAFMQTYCANMPDAPRRSLEKFWWAWNTADADLSQPWAEFVDALPTLERHAQAWAEEQAFIPDLARQLVNFSLSKL